MQESNREANANLKKAESGNGHDSQQDQIVGPDIADQSQPDVVPAQALVDTLQAQIKEKENKYLYLYAEFENFKKRTIRERADLLKFGWESVARDLLEVVDNLDRAAGCAPPQTDKKLIDGLNLVAHQFRSTLQKQGVEMVKSLNEAFNPELHEAVGQEPAKQPAGTVIVVHQPGYTLHGRLLRPARVVISAGPAAE